MFDFDGANIGLVFIVFLLFTQSRQGAKFFILSMIIVEFSVFSGIRFLTTKS